MKIFYYYLYYRIYHFAKKISDDALNEMKSGATIIILELLIITQFFVWLQIFQFLSKKAEDFVWSKAVLVAIVVLLIICNYYVFLYKERWKKYNNKFKSYSKSKIRQWNFTIAGIIVVIFSGFIFAFYLLYHMPLESNISAP